MNKFILFVITVFTSISAMANGYCDGRPTKAERDRCYAVNNQTYDYHAMANKAVRTMNANIEAIQKAEQIPQDKKKEFLAGVRKSQGNIDAGCKDNKCVYYSVTQLNERMVHFYNYHVK